MSSKQDSKLSDKEIITEELSSMDEELETGKARIFELEKEREDCKIKEHSGVKTDLEKIETELNQLMIRMEKLSKKKSRLEYLSQNFDKMEQVYKGVDLQKKMQEKMQFQYIMKTETMKKLYADDAIKLKELYNRRLGYLLGLGALTTGGLLWKITHPKNEKEEEQSMEKFLQMLQGKQSEPSKFMEFKNEQIEVANDLMTKALLNVYNEQGELDPYLLKRVKKLLCNTTWDISGALLDFETNMQHMGANSGYIYFYGEPGIGKSSVFASLVCHLNDPRISDQFKRLFPYFKPHEKFIYIDGSSQKLRRMTDQDLNLILQTLIQQKYVVVLDEVLEMMDNQKTMLFLEQLKDQCKSLIMLSPHPPPIKTQTFKNILHKKQLVELPLNEAVEQISMTLRKFTFGRFMPDSEREYFAYKIWFYIGGNLRKLSQIFYQDLISHENYFKNAGDVARNESNIEIADGKYKGKRAKEIFSEVIQYLEGKGIPQQHIWSTMLGTLQCKVYRVAQSEIENFVKANILTTRNYTFNDKKYKMLMTDILGFHSRRMQFALAHHLLHESDWKDKEKDRAEFQRFLERIDIKHTLDFQLYKVKKAQGEEEILQFINQMDHVKLEKQEEQELDDLLGRQQELFVLQKLTEFEIKLVMLYYEAIQIYSYGDGYSPRSLSHDDEAQIIEKLKKGHQYLYKNYTKPIDEVLQKKPELKQEIEKLKATIEKIKVIEALIYRQELLEQELEGYKKDVKIVLDKSAVPYVQAEEWKKLVDKEDTKIQSLIGAVIHMMRSKEEQALRLVVALIKQTKSKLKKNMKEIEAIPEGKERLEKHRVEKQQMIQKRKEEAIKLAQENMEEVLVKTPEQPKQDDQKPKVDPMGENSKKEGEAKKEETKKEETKKEEKKQP